MGEKARSFYLGCHVGEFELDDLVLRDWLVELCVSYNQNQYSSETQHRSRHEMEALLGAHQLH